MGTKRDDQADKATDDYMESKNLSGPRGSFRKGFCSGWNACLKHLASIPWDEAMNEIANYCKEKEE